MRLPARIAPCFFVLSMGVAVAQTPPKTELQGGGLQQAPQQITRVDAASGPQTTEAAPQPFGYESEVHCFGYIGDRNEQFIASVIGAENLAATPGANPLQPGTKVRLQDRIAHGRASRSG